MKGFLEVSLNFIPFIDSVYYINPKNQGKAKVNFVEGLTSYLTSLPKFYEYQFQYSKDHSKNVINEIENTLNKKLAILQRH